MTREDIIAMAREAGVWIAIGNRKNIEEDGLERFAALVAAAEQKKWFDQTEVEINEAVLDEREACAKVCEARYMGDNNREDMEAKRCAEAIRNRRVK